MADKPGRDATVIGCYEARFAAFEQELGPESITPKRRILMLTRNAGGLSATNSHALIWHRAGLAEAQSQSFVGSLNAESVLTIDPDILLMIGDLTPSEVWVTPSPRDLRAVCEGRAYTLPPGLLLLGGVCDEPVRNCQLERRTNESRWRL